MKKSFWTLLAVFILVSTSSQAQVVRTVTNLFDSGKGTLRDAIGLCTSGDTVRFTVSGTITLTNGSINFNSGIYIDGGHKDSITVNGGGNYTIFNITGGDVTIKGLTLENAEPYGVYFYASSDSLTILDCAINGCTNENGYGPGVYVPSSKSVFIKGTSFENNSIYGDGRPRVYGGAVYASSSSGVEIDNCVFSKNNASSVNWGGTGSDAEGYGGAMYVRSPKLSLSNSSFTSNSARGGGCCGYRPNWSIAQGGALYFDGSEMIMDNCHFKSNRISSSDFRNYHLNQGNAVFLDEVDSVEIRNSSFRSNTSSGGTYTNLYGGCIYVYLKNYLKVSNTTISSNSSREIGALCVDARTDGQGRVILDKVRIDSNSVSTGNHVSAAFFRDVKYVKVANSRFAESKGVGIWTKNVGQVEVMNSLFDASKTNHIYLNNPSGSNNLIVNSTFRNSGNRAIYYDNTSSNYVTNNTFVNNTGDVYLNKGAALFTNNIFTYDKFISNAFSRAGSEVPLSGGGNIVKGSSFSSYFTKSNDINTRDPQLDAFANHGGYTKTYSLSSKSDAINLGGKDSLTYDQRGFVRDSLSDAGAFEYGGTDPFFVAIDTIQGNTRLCTGDTVRINVTVTGKTGKYAWLKNGVPLSGQTSLSLQLDSVTPTDSGQYSCVVYNAQYRDTSEVLTVKVYDYPTVAAVGADTICTGDTASLSASGAQTYSWDIVNADKATIKVTPMSTTVYTVTGTSNGCSSNDQVRIQVDTTPVVVAIGQDTICEGQGTWISATGADAYSWWNGVGVTDSIRVVPTTTTMYKVTGTSKTCSAVDSVLITVNPLPILVVRGDTIVCEGQQVPLSASGATMYSWNNNAGDSSHVLVTPEITTTYSVKGIQNNCSSEADVTVEVKPSPDVIVQASDSAVCDSGSVILSASGAHAYTWDNGLGTSSSVIVKLKETTTYTVTGEKDGCTDESEITIYAFERPDPPILQNGETLETGFYTSYQWQWNNNPIDGATERSFTPKKNGDYSVEVMEDNGCSGISSTVITIDDLVSINELFFSSTIQIVPNPNKGNFYLRGAEWAQKVEIYNAIGEQVAQITWSSHVSDASIQLETLPAGVYVLMATDGQKQTFRRFSIE
ncbi:MAG: right-handed parallel beta-helix repeat-containing protein [Bacteroidia bacterium]|nr:right-handed parallel beta-helix repeat-containing protein [Bacteroidia bacterium]